MIWVVFALLTGAAVFAVLWPLSRAPAETDARALDVAFYKAQTEEIARDEARGAIQPVEAEVARTEAARRLVAAGQRPVRDLARSSRRLAVGTALAALVFVPALALGLYTKIGAPDLPDAPLQARLDAPPADMDMATAIGKIERHLAEAPNDGRGWSVLAPIYLRLQRFDDAKQAYANVIRLLGPSAERYAGLGQAELGLGGGRVTPDARRAFEQALALDARAPAPSFYLGLAAEQAGDKAKAGTIWRQLLANSPPTAPWIETVRTHIAALGDGPAPVPVGGAPAGQGPDMNGKMAAVAAMPKDQQQAMIQSMVDRLASRLKTNGNDIEGWLRLVRAYRVLEEEDKAKVALADARKTFASDPAATKRLDDLAQELGLKG